MSDNIYPKGFFIKPAHENAPEFVKGRVSIKVEDFTNYLKECGNSDGWCNFQLLNGKNGLYLKLDTWTPEKKAEGSGVEDDDDLPF